MLKRLKVFWRDWVALSWSMLLDRYLGGHIDIGSVAIFGHNAMHWGVEIRTKKYGYVCFRLPIPCFGQMWGWWYLYFSPNGTPWAATLLMGPRFTEREKREAKERFRECGHNHRWGLSCYECKGSICWKHSCWLGANKVVYCEYCGNKRAGRHQVIHACYGPRPGYKTRSGWMQGA